MAQDVNQAHPVTEEATLAARYRAHSLAMGHAMRECRDHLVAGATLDLAPSELVDYIANCRMMLGEATYHAERMVVYSRLIISKGNG